MKPNADKVFAEAMELSAADRADLVARLEASIEPKADPDVEAAWIEEARSRWSAYERGEIKSHAGDDVFDSQTSESSL